MEKIYLDENIYYIQNVLSTDALAVLDEYCRDQDSWVSKNVGKDHWKNNVKSSNTSAIIALDGLSRFIRDEVDTKDMMISLNNNLSRFVPGEETDMAMGYHHDNSKPHTLSGIVFYINDDYEGGEIHYKEKDILFKPIKNTLVFHPSSEEYIHGVKPVKNGERYMITMFGYERDWLEPQILKDLED